LTFGEMRNRKNPRRMLQHHARQIEVQSAANARRPVRLVHVFQHVVDGDDVAAGKIPWEPEKMWNMDEIATEAAQDGPALHISEKSIGCGKRYGFEIVGQLANFSYFFGWAEQKVFIVVIELRQRANDIASVSANAELVDAPNVESNTHD